MRVISWNVNGLRAAAKKGFRDFLEGSGAAIVGIQEARTEELPEGLRPTRPDLHGYVAPDDLFVQEPAFEWHTALAAGERKGYSGVGLFARPRWDTLDASLAPEFDVEGRTLFARFGRLTVVTGYFPNGNGQNRDNSRIPYKLDYYRAMFAKLEPARAAGEPILVMGDLNTAHQPIDLARPRENAKTSGFTDVERAELGRWLAAGWTDTYRAAHPDVAGAYSWWSQRFGIRAKNIGWRLDLVLASPGVLPFIRKAFIRPDVMGSDHCPVGVTLNAKVLRP